jgi:hypothetical protein
MLHKDYDIKGSVKRIISGLEAEGAWRQDELFGSKPSLVKQLPASDSVFKGLMRVAIL